MRKKHLLSPVLLIIAGAFLVPATGDIATAAEILDSPVGAYRLVSKKKVGRVVYEYVYTAVITNSGGNSYASVEASLKSHSPYTVIVDGVLAFGNVPPNSTVRSSDTFIIQQDRRMPFSPRDLAWTVTGSLPTASPPKSARQSIGLYDTVYNSLPDEACRKCHNDPGAEVFPSTKEIHHRLEVPDGCASCHAMTDGEVNLPVVRGCHECHIQLEGQPTVHHALPAALARDCKACHENVDNPLDGHYIPTYKVSIVTPNSGLGYGKSGQGGCAFCHRASIDATLSVMVHSNAVIHHSTGIASPPFWVFRTECQLCHSGFFGGNPLNVRGCETCHGISSLHNIQADSNGDKRLSAGEEFPYYGHIGGPRDCMGCHGGFIDYYFMQAEAVGGQFEPTGLEGLKITAAATGAPPPVRQALGMSDIPYYILTEENCRACHEDPQRTKAGYLADRHHLRVGRPVQSRTDMPYATELHNGGDGTYNCLSCHKLVRNTETGKYQFEPFRDCTLCHVQKEGEGTVHHRTPWALQKNCKVCHGLIDNPDDGHYIPTYQASLVTPKPGFGGGSEGSGGCAFCHGEASDPSTGIQVYSNVLTHHSAGIVKMTDTEGCALCHAVGEGSIQIRSCETCHGVASLHNIQAYGDANDWLSPGNEPAGHGHIGRHDDCWGCHGFTVKDDNGVLTEADRHHAYVNRPVLPDSVKPYSEYAGAGDVYTCLSCHRLILNNVSNKFEFEPFRECVSCHR